MTEPITKELLQTLITAVEDEGAEARAFSSSYTLGKGVKIATASHRPLYSFSLANPPRLQEEARGRLYVKGAVVECTVLSRRSDGLDVATFIDLGDEIESASLTVDRSELLSILAARLEGLTQDPPPFPFNSALAAEVLDISKITPSGDDSFVAAPDDLTSDQQEAFRRAVRNNVTFLWGPPGTGKTVTLSAIAFDLFRNNKRVLLVSHTNRAVDGVVLSLCKRVVGKARASLPEGSIVRVGAISRKALATSFGGQIGLEALAESHQRKVRERIATVRKERDLNAQDLESVRQQYGLAARQKVLEEELSGLQKLYGEARSSESSMATVLRVLRIRYGSGDGSGTSIDEIKRSIKTVTSEILEVASQLEKVSAEEVHDQMAQLETRDEELTEAIRDLELLVEDASLSALHRARVVACTATQAMLRCQSLGEFDAVIVDEASMLPLPFIVFLSGLAKEKVVIGGDFRQLPPISLSQSPAVREWFARDIFEAAGVVDIVDGGGESPFLATLTTQFRGHESLSAVINDRFYGGRLVAKHKTPDLTDSLDTPEWLRRSSIMLVDSSSLKPVGHVENKSKVNISHALLVRNVCAALRTPGREITLHDIGVIAPYRPQVTLLEDLLEEAGMSDISVGTAHRFQGAERETIIVDLTESAPHSVGGFLGATSLREPGAKLLNVSLSRAQSRLIVVANLSYLRASLGEHHVLHGVLQDLERLGCVIDAREVVPDAVTSQVTSRFCTTLPQRFDSETFLAGITADLNDARSSVVISSQRIGIRSAHIFATVLKPLVERGVDVQVVTSGLYSSLDARDTQQATSILRDAGIVVTQEGVAALQSVIVDDEVVWLGNTPPLNSVDVGDLLMVRVVSPVGAHVLSRVVGSSDTGGRAQPLAANT